MRIDDSEASARTAHAHGLRASGRREAAMAEEEGRPGGSPGPAAPSAPGSSAEPQQGERCAGGSNPETEGAAAGQDVSNPPASKKPTPCSSSRKPRASSSPGVEQQLNYCGLSPIVATPRGKRRSWCRSSLKGRRSRRKSLPPVHQDVTELSKSINLELPEVQRLCSLLLLSFQFSAQKLQQILEKSEGFDPEIFAAKVQSGSETFQRFLQKLLQDGTLRNCLEIPKKNSLDSALDGSVAQVKELMASFSVELHAWALLLQQHVELHQETTRNLDLLKSGNSSQETPEIGNFGNSQISQILNSKPNYGEILREQQPILQSLQLRVDELQEAGKLLKEFSEESRNFLKHLSEQLASRAFRNLPESPARKLLERKSQKALE